MMWLDRVISLFKKRARCPVGNADRFELDRVFSHLIEEFGEEFILKSEVYIDVKGITGREFSGNEAYAQALFKKLGDIMDVDLEPVELGLFSEPGDVLLDSGVVLVSEDRGRFAPSKFTEYSDGSVEILVNSGYLKDPTCLVASIAFELARLKLRREGKEYADADVSIELVLLFFGLGVFNANSSVVKVESWAGDLKSGWNIKKGPSQLSPEIHGYILALFSHYRGEDNPDWASSLEKEVIKAFYTGLKYLGSRSE